MNRRQFGIGAGASAALLASGAKAQFFNPVAPGFKATFPTGAVGLWFADQYSSSNKAIPNQINSAPLPNLTRCPRRQFNNINFWVPGSLTVVDNAATAPDGSNDASTITSTAGGWFLAMPNLGVMQVNGQDYTVAINAKRNTGADQVFAFSKDNTGTRSAVKTATSSWQRFSYTFNSGGNSFTSILLCSSDGATDADLQICDFEVYLGTSDLGPTAPMGDLYLGYSGLPSANQPSVSGGLLDLTGGSGGVGFLQLPSAAAFSDQAFTMMVLAEKGASANSYLGYFSNIGDYSKGSAYLDINNAPHDAFTNVYAEAGGTGLWTLLGTGLHVITTIFDGTTAFVYLDDIPFFRHAASVGAATLSDFAVGWVNTIVAAALKINTMALWPRALSLTEVRVAAQIIRSRAQNVSGLSAPPWTRCLLAEGDSITGGQTYCYPYQNGYSPATLGNNAATSGAALSNLTTRAAALDILLPPSTNRAGRKFLFSVLVGANDLATYPGGASQYAIDYAAYCDARRAAGWTLIVITVLPNTHIGFNALRATLNTEIRLWTTNGSIVPGQHADAICDFAADPTMGPDGAELDTTYYADGLHPTATGQAILAGIYAATVNAL